MTSRETAYFTIWLSAANPHPADLHDWIRRRMVTSACSWLIGQPS
ncbi:hypothetical protein [Micromonospora sp. WMMC250]|nr:hypothetical protein [Micromonospora sp. WMMC250]MCZ7373289.1 hypothetical protein [Micromonospora sp. WMMC250]MCZ7373328.1 hypothetical protein [Micromonospora sp. WMMC250]